MIERPPIVGVFGGRTENGRVAVSEDAFEIGAIVARLGVVLLTGANGWSAQTSSEAKDRAIKGAIMTRADASVICVPPLSAPRSEFKVLGKRLIVMSNLTDFERDPVNALTSDIVLGLGGGAGTACELAFAVCAGRETILLRKAANQLLERIHRVPNEPKDAVNFRSALRAYGPAVNVTGIDRLIETFESYVKDRKNTAESPSSAVCEALRRWENRKVKELRFPGIPNNDPSSIKGFAVHFGKIL